MVYYYHNSVKQVNFNARGDLPQAETQAQVVFLSVCLKSKSWLASRNFSKSPTVFIF